ncbi:MAG: hypothetical protein KAS32_30190 [Candidatus Peribacteraceae bacterium]|nr:hypothetical protein [Candidatus Peribacteraceae bacterium]
MDKYIRVPTCGYCPWRGDTRVKDGPTCSHSAVSGMEVGDYMNTIHPRCPLDDIADDPNLILKQHGEMLEMLKKAARDLAPHEHGRQDDCGSLIHDLINNIEER